MYVWCWCYVCTAAGAPFMLTIPLSMCVVLFFFLFLFSLIALKQPNATHIRTFYISARIKGKKVVSTHTQTHVHVYTENHTNTCSAARHVCVCVCVTDRRLPVLRVTSIRCVDVWECIIIPYVWQPHVFWYHRRPMALCVYIWLKSYRLADNAAYGNTHSIVENISVQMQRQQKSFSQYLRAASLFSVVAMHQQIDLLDCIPVHGKPANLRLSLSPPFLLLPCKPNKHTFVLTSVFWWPFVCLMPAYISFNTFFCSHCLYAFVCLQRPFYRKKCTWAPSMVYSLIDLSIFSRHKHTLRKAVAMRVTPTRIALTHELPIRAMTECSEQ